MQINNNKQKIYLCSTTNLCEINHHHTTEVKNYLIQNGYQLVNNSEEATHILAMTCGALQSSEDRTIKKLEELGVYTSSKSFYIMGCLPGIHRNLPIFKKATCIGARELNQLEDVFPGRVKINQTETNLIDYKFLQLRDKIPNRFTLVVVQGCLGSCTYCAIHKAKGVAKSQSIESILRRVRNIVKNNNNPNIAFLGEDFGSYGSDIGSSPVELLEKVTQLEGKFALEIQNFEPYRFLLFFNQLEKIFQSNKIAKMHIAVQTGSQEVLAKMGRKYDIKAVVENIKKLTFISPKLALETSFIINFPGETFEDFLSTIKLIPEFDEVTVYNFSPRQGTKAATQEPRISEKEQNKRIQIISELQKVHPGIVFM